MLTFEYISRVFRIMKKILSLLACAAAVISCGTQKESLTVANLEKLAPLDASKKYEVRYGEIAPGGKLELEANDIRKNTTLEAVMTFPGGFGGITIGRGDQKHFYSYWIDVTATDFTVSYHEIGGPAKVISTQSHGMDISSNLTVKIVYTDQSTADLILKSGKAARTFSVNWWGGGAPFVRNNGSSSANARLTFIPYDQDKPVWIIGDSYISWSAQNRWPYYLYTAGYKNWMADHTPGAGSAAQYAEFHNDLKFGTPKYVIWAMGMNDGPDNADSPTDRWLIYVKKFIADCEERGIIPILTTTPSIPKHNHQQMCKWVRESGYRYIDFSAAVTGNDALEWYPGYLSSDNIHPAAPGAKALADQVLKDFPEIKD